MVGQSEETRYVPISCGDYEHLELACQHRYDLDVTTLHEGVIHGTANTLFIKDGAEYFELSTPTGAVHIRVDKITNLLVLSENAHFYEYLFDRGRETEPTRQLSAS